MKTFYKINLDGSASTGSGLEIPNGFIEYDIYNKPQELLDALSYLSVEQAEIKFTAGIEAFIQNEVEKLNITNDVAFANIHNCKSFAMTVGYEFQAECQALTDWAFLTVWPTMRAWQKTLIAIPTDAEFQAELDKIPFAG